MATDANIVQKIRTKLSNLETKLDTIDDRIANKRADLREYLIERQAKIQEKQAAIDALIAEKIELQTQVKNYKEDLA